MAFRTVSRGPWVFHCLDQRCSFVESKRDWNWQTYSWAAKEIALLYLNNVTNFRISRHARAVCLQTWQDTTFEVRDVGSFLLIDVYNRDLKEWKKLVSKGRVVSYQAAKASISQNGQVQAYQAIYQRDWRQVDIARPGNMSPRITYYAIDVII